MANDVYGIDELRKAVALFDGCRESFNKDYDVVGLMAIYRAFKACGSDIQPDRWDTRQVEETIKGRVPTFDDQERPTFDD